MIIAVLRLMRNLAMLKDSLVSHSVQKFEIDAPHMREVVGSIPTATTTPDSVKNSPRVVPVDDFGRFSGIR